MFTANQTVTNTGTGAVAARPYALISRAEESEDPDSWTMHVGPIGVFHEAANYDWSYEDIVEEGDQRFASTGGWLGFSDKYWLTALVPPPSDDISAAFRRGAHGGCQANSRRDHTIVKPGQPIPHQ